MLYFPPFFGQNMEKKTQTYAGRRNRQNSWNAFCIVVQFLFCSKFSLQLLHFQNFFFCYTFQLQVSCTVLWSIKIQNPRSTAPEKSRLSPFFLFLFPQIFRHLLSLTCQIFVSSLHYYLCLIFDILILITSHQIKLYLYLFNFAWRFHSCWFVHGIWQHI